MILDLDIGNTLAKWRYRSSGGDLLGSGVAATVAELTAELEALAFQPGRVRASCVANPAFLDELDAWLSPLGLQSERLVATAACGGVTSGYREPGQLGIDRWLAVCGAWDLVKGSCVVVDAGSALTVDVIDADGQHQGGYIVPGFSLCQRSLTGKASQIEVSGLPEGAELAPGANTTEAVQRGAILMLAALVERACKEAGDNPVLLLCGGDAPLVGGALGLKYRHEPDLVFQGMDIVAP